MVDDVVTKSVAVDVDVVNLDSSQQILNSKSNLINLRSCGYRSSSMATQNPSVNISRKFKTMKTYVVVVSDSVKCSVRVVLVVVASVLRVIDEYG